MKPRNLDFEIKNIMYFEKRCSGEADKGVLIGGLIGAELST